jgi:hypothetical protein
VGEAGDKAGQRRLHPFSWLVLALSSLVMVLLVVPGLPGKASVVSAGSGTNAARRATREFAHGWPMTIGRRTVGYPALAPTTINGAFVPIPDVGISIGGYAISWTGAEAWPWSGSEVTDGEFSPVALAVDGVVAILVVGVVTAGVERWVRRRGGVWRWRIVDFAFVIAVVAIVLGYVMWVKGKHDGDVRTLSELQRWMVNEQRLTWENQAPGWLCRLAGNGRLRIFDRLIRVKAVHMAGPTTTKWISIGRLSELRELEVVVGTPSSADFAELERLPHLESLSWGDPPETVAEWLPRLKGLRTLSLNYCEWSDEEVEKVRAAMPGVEVNVTRREAFRRAE